MLSEGTKERKRTGRLNVRLEDEMISRLEEVSKHLCLAPSTVGALAIAEFVNARLAERKMIDMQADGIANALKETLGNHLSNPESMKVISDSRSKVNNQLDLMKDSSGDS